MKLHWSPRSPFVRKVMICAHELDLLSRIQLVRSVAAMTKPNPDIMRDNPLSKIPTLVLDNGTALFDSLVICEYLNDLAGGALFPAQAAEKWPALRWHAFANGLLDILVLWRNEREKEPPLSTLLHAFAQKTRASLAQFEKEVSSLAAAPTSIGHVTVACMLGYLDFRFDDLGWRSQAPHLAAWHRQFAVRPSYTATGPSLAE
jgi:glutathione S-transferase